MLGRDNPSVNITLENLIDQKLKKLGSGLLFLGSCNLHVVHNGFKAGNIVYKYLITGLI
ncbi:unnamed protein product, partial [Rotaria magnacalcarata]